MGELDVLPATPGLYRVETLSGTVHIISRTPQETMWERRPVGDSNVVGGYDFEPVPVRFLDEGWKVGRQGYLVVSDETHLTYPTWHRTSRIVSITELPQ